MNRDGFTFALVRLTFITCLTCLLPLLPRETMGGCWDATRAGQNRCYVSHTWFRVALASHLWVLSTFK